ncbi:MAG: CAP domain-containing protein, partial [Acidimicrobiia bacterium]
VSSSLNNYARDWSQEMATSGNFRHSNIASLLGPWGIVGENIGRGGSVVSIFNALLDSPPHYANMVDTRFTHLGVGVFIDSSGKLWTTHVFGG